MFFLKDEYADDYREFVMRNVLKNSPSLFNEEAIVVGGC